MRRTVQIWELTDDQRQPLSHKFPGQAIVDLLARSKGAGTDLHNLHRDGTETLLEPVVGSTRPHVCLYRVRRANLPAEDAGGTIVPLSIPAQHGLAEGTHIVCYPRNIVGVLFNFEGPRVRRFTEWLNDRLGLALDVRPVYRDDVRAVVDAMVKVTKVELSLPAYVAADFVHDDDRDVFRALTAASEVAGGGLVRLELSVGQGAGAVDQSRYRTLVNRLLGRNLSSFNSARIHGRLPEEQGNTVVDLINSQLVARRDVEPERSRSTQVSTVSAYEAIDSTFQLFREQISRAVEPIDGGAMALPRTLREMRSADDT